MNTARAIGFCALLAALFVSAGAAGQTAQDLLQQGIHLEDVKGQLEQAIAIYERVLKEHPKERSIAAKAQLHIGLCYEKLDPKKAIEAFRKVISNYSDQREAAAEAGTRLAAMTSSPKNGAAMAARRLWTFEDTKLLGSVSLDGRYLVYDTTYNSKDAEGLSVRELATGKKRVLVKGPYSGGYPSSAPYISPDGKQVAYDWTNYDGPRLVFELRTIGFEGGSPRVLYRNNDEVEYIDLYGWSPDGKHLLSLFRRKDKAHQIALVAAADGSVRVLKTLGWSYPAGMSFSPDSRYIAYDLPPSQGQPEQRDLFVLAADGSRETVLVSHPASDELLGWAPDGRHVVFTSDRRGTKDAWVVAIADGKLAGSPELVKRDVGDIKWVLGLSRAGALYYQASTNRTDVYIADLDLNASNPLGVPQRITHRFEGANSDPDWSPDGRRVAYISARQDGKVIVIHSLETGEERDSPRRFQYLSNLRWHPDWRSFLAKGIDEKARNVLFRIDAETGESTVLLESGADYIDGAEWSPDGKAIFYRLNNYDTLPVQSRISRLDLETGQQRQLWQGGPGGNSSSVFTSPAPSPDGQLLAFRGPQGIHIISATAPNTSRQLLKEKIDWLSWTPGGDLLVLKPTDGAQELWRISVENGEGQRLGPPLKGGQERDRFRRISPDGRRIALTQVGQTDTEIWVLENFLPASNARK